MAKQHVKAWQEHLLSLGYDLGSYGADGSFGQLTLNASYEAVGVSATDNNDNSYGWHNYATGQVTEHFNVSEFKCKDGTEVPESLYDNLLLLCQMLEIVRTECNAPINIASGYRTQSYNDKLYGKSDTNSMHIFAAAADIACPTTGREKLQAICKQLYDDGTIGGYGHGTSCTHIDVRHLVDKTKYPYANYKSEWTY